MPRPASGSHHGTAPAAYGRRGRGRVHRQQPDDAQHGQHERAGRQPGARQGDRRQARSLLGREHEVRGGADHREQRPEHAERREVRARQQVEDEDEADRGQAGAGDGQRSGPLAVAQPQPDHHRGGRGVLDQQRRPDVHPLDGREVAELRAGDRQRAEQQDEPGVLAQRAPAAAQRADGERRDDERAEREPDQDDRARRPAGVEQAAGQRARRARTPLPRRSRTAARRPAVRRRARHSSYSAMGDDNTRSA